jgi:predicted RND superfamily exporter protein
MRWSYSSWVAFLERRHRAVIVASALLGMAGVLSLGRLRLDIDVLSMLPQGTPAFDEFRSFVGELGKLNELFVLVDGEDPARVQRFAATLAERWAALDEVDRVQVRVDIDHLLDGLLGRRLWSYLPDEAWDEVERRLTPAAIDARVAANRAMLAAPFDLSAARLITEDPLGLRQLAAAAVAASYAGAGPSLTNGYFTSRDGRAVLLYVWPTASAFDAAFSERLLERATAVVEATRAELRESPEHVRVAWTGSYVYALEDQRTLKGDIARYVVLALAGVLGIFLLGYRNLRILPFVTYPMVLTTLATFVLSLLLFEQLNAVSLCFAAILYGLSIDSGIHLYTRLLEERRDRGALREAVAATLRGIGLPGIAASLTTAAAFVVIGASALSAVSQIGILTALGMVLSAVFLFTLYPALSFALPASSAPTFALSDTPRLGRIAAAATRNGSAILLAAAVCGVGLLWVATGVRLDVTLTHLRPADSEAVRVQDEIETRFGSSSGAGAFVVRRTSLDAALADAEALSKQLRTYKNDGSVIAVYAIDGALPSPAAQRQRFARLARLPRGQAVEELRGALARHGFAVERFASFLARLGADGGGEQDIVRYGDPDLEPLAPLIDRHVQRLKNGERAVVIYVEPRPGASLAPVAARLRADLPEIAFGVASRSLLEEELARVLRRELFWFCVFGVLGNLLLLYLLFRRLGIAVAILAPVALVVVALFAGMAVTGVALNPVNLIVTPLVFGIGVDFGVYVAARARECGDVPGALSRTGRALVVAALTTVAGFGFLGLSHYPFLASMGVLACIGLCLSLLGSIVVLPPLLVRLGGVPAAFSGARDGADDKG